VHTIERGNMERENEKEEERERERERESGRNVSDRREMVR
jgi:hypothetical protein